MKAIVRNLALGVAVLAIAVLVFLAFDTAGPGFSTSALTKFIAPSAAATPPPGEVIPLQSIADLNSLNGTVKLNVNGLIDGKKTKGELNGQLNVSDPKTSQVTVSGSLLGPTRRPSRRLPRRSLHAVQGRRLQNAGCRLHRGRRLTPYVHQAEGINRDGHARRHEPGGPD